MHNKDEPSYGRAIAQTVFADISPRKPGIMHSAVHVGFVVDEVTLGQAYLYNNLQFQSMYHLNPIAY
jgi:hypothetical protein